MKKVTMGWAYGLLGVIIFSGSLPATRVAVAEISPIFLTSVRAVIAAVLGAMLLLFFQQKRPGRNDMYSLAIVASGVVIGFPLLTGFALQHITAAHSIVFVGLLPLSTTIFGILRGRERPKPAFWLFAILGAIMVAGFALSINRKGSLIGDYQMLAAIIVCGLGYAEGAILSRRLGSWQVISWALLFSFPVMAATALLSLPTSWSHIGLPAWIGLAYVSIFSMLIGFIFWYRGLALGGIASVSQLQLLQPFFGLFLAAMLLHEYVTGPMIIATIVVVLCIVGARRFST